MSPEKAGGSRMSKTANKAKFGHWGVSLAVLCLVMFPSLLFSGGKPHPLQGTVTALGTRQQTTGGGTTNVFTYEHRTYTVRTDTRVFVLECPYAMNGFHIAAPSECGGKKKIAIGDVIHFRLEKNNAFVVTDQGKDEKLRVVSEAVNADKNPTSPVSQQ